MYYRQNLTEEIGRFFRSKAVLPRLIIINVAVWLAIGIMRVFSFLFNIPDSSLTSFIVEYLAVPAQVSDLLTRPWTLLTYMFLHIDFFHILFNMLWLFWFGKIFLEFLKSRQLLLVYILGGLSGAFLYVLFYNIFPVFEKSLDMSVALGASASVMAIVTTISLYVPGYTIHMLFLGRIRIFYIALFLFILDFFMIRSSNAGGHIAHIGGAIFGIVYVLSNRKGMNFSGFIEPGWTKRFLSKFKRKRSNAYYNTTSTGYGRPLSDEEYNRKKAEKQRKIDDILEKISKSGYPSLTKEEKDYLFRSGDSDTK